MKYNGWKNYETWCVALWLSNEYESQKELEEVAKEEDMDAYRMESYIKNMVEEMTPEVEGVFSDLLTHAIERVDFLEIANSYLED